MKTLIAFLLLCSTAFAHDFYPIPPKPQQYTYQPYRWQRVPVGQPQQIQVMTYWECRPGLFGCRWRQRTVVLPVQQSVGPQQTFGN